MSPFDVHGNFAYGLILTPPSPALTGDTIVLQAGQGADLSSEGLLDGPSFIDATAQDGSRNSSASRPFNGRMSLALIGQQSPVRHYRGCQGLFRRVATPQSPSKSVLVDAMQFAPLDLRSSDSVDREQTVTAHVPTVLSLWNPSAITRLIVAVVINTIQRQPIRRFAHILKKVVEVQPTLAHGDTSSSVEIEVHILRTVATLQHVFPCCLCACAHDDILVERQIA